MSRLCETKGEAQRWMRAVEKEMDDGRFAVPERITAAKLLEDYRDKVSARKKGARWEKTRINLFLRTLPWLKKNVHDITPQDIIRWRDKRLLEVKPDSVHREMTVLSTVFTHAMKEWQLRLKDNPVHLVRRPKRGKKRNRRPVGDELQRYQDACATSRGTLTRNLPLLLELAAETGMRRGEFCGVDWADVNLDAQWVHLHDTKNDTERYVPLTERAVEILRTLGPGSGKVVKSSPDTVTAMHRKVCRKAGIKDLRVHDMRHEAASRISDKVGPLDLAKIFGWKRMDEALTYYNPTPEELAAKLNKKPPAQAGGN